MSCFNFWGIRLGLDSWGWCDVTRVAEPVGVAAAAADQRRLMDGIALGGRRVLRLRFLGIRCKHFHTEFQVSRVFSGIELVEH